MSGIAIIIKGADYSNRGLGKVHINIIPITGINISASSVVIDKDTSTLQLSAILTPNDTTQTGIAWNSSNTDVATIDNNGLITVDNRPSTDTTIVFTATSTSNPNISDSISITVKASEQAFELVTRFDTVLEKSNETTKVIQITEQRDSSYNTHIRACIFAKNPTEHIDKSLIGYSPRYSSPEEFAAMLDSEGIEPYVIKGVKTITLRPDMTKLNAKGIVGCSYGVFDIDNKTFLNEWKWWTTECTVNVSADSDYSPDKQYAIITNFKSSNGYTSNTITDLPEIGVDFNVEITY